MARRPLDRRRLRRFLIALGATSSKPTTAYLVGGATAIVSGWRTTTIDVDLHLEPERDELLRAIPRLKEDLEVNVEFASPLDFLPELPDWRERSPYVDQYASLTVRHFDPYSQALAKLERAFSQDLADVAAMVERDLVEPQTLKRLFEEIYGHLYRFPTVDPDRLRRSVERLEML